MRRADRLLFASIWCAACGDGASRVERPRAVSPAASALAAPSELSLLPVLARPAGPSEPLRFLEPANGAELDAASAASLSVRVKGPPAADTGTLLELSLDGARPRPVASGTLTLAELLEPNVGLAPGAHDLVLVTVGADGVALDPAAGGVASLRFYVGARPAVPPLPRLVCLSPFGTFYGSAPRVFLDFVVTGGDPVDVDVTVEGPGAARRARAVGRGPFGLGDFESGEHRVSLTPARGAPPMVSTGCAFVVNRELEKPP